MIRWPIRSFTCVVVVATVVGAACGSNIERRTGVRATSTSPVRDQSSALSSPPPLPGFFPSAAWFVGSQRGWVIGRVGCGQAMCGALRVTHNGGASWASLRSPSPDFSGLGAVAFADASNGWVLAQDSADAGGALFATHDGAKSWSKMTLIAYDLLVTSTRVWVSARAASGYALYFAPTDGGAFTRVAPTQGPSLSSIGDEVLAWNEVPRDSGRQVLTVVSGMRPLQRTLPCSTAFTIAVAARNPTHLFAICGSEGGTGNQVKHAYASNDGGNVWQLEGTMPIGGYVGTLAATPSRLILVGARLSVLVSIDDGHTWHIGFAGDGTAGATSAIRFTDALHGSALSDTQLITTNDGGVRWTAHSIK